MAEHAPWHVNLFPQRRVESALAQPLDGFVANQAGNGLLLVSLKNQTSKLLAGLTAIDGEPTDPTASDILDPSTSFGQPSRQTWPAELVRLFNESVLAGMVEKARHFVV